MGTRKMISSVIPARLQFQCGHAALVTLQRIKGETVAQRNLRVAREKAAALARQCDFCAPSVAVVEAQLAVMNWDDLDIAQSDLVELAPASELAVSLTTTLESEVTESEMGAESAPVPEEPAAPDIVDMEPEPAQPDMPQPATVEAIIASQTEPVEEREHEQTTVPREAGEVAPEPRLPGAPHLRRQRRRALAGTPTAAATTPTRVRRAPAPHARPTYVGAVSGHEFLVEYQVQRMILATSIHDALRQVAAMGALEVLAITRQD